MPFSIFYYILSVALYLIALPLLLFLSFKKKYRESIPSRFFLLNNPPFSKKDAVWFHVCSFGEAKAIKPILDQLDGEDILITTITHTGQTQVRSYNAETRYLPYEMFIPFWTRKQRVVVILEAEFWFMLFAVMKAKGARVILLNARISEKSAKKYLQFAWFYQKMLQHVEIIYAQSEEDKNRFLALGAKNIEVVGNIKLAAKIAKTKTYSKPSKEIIVAGSTHDTEEESILKSFVEYKKQVDATLIIVPRHPERFANVYTLMQEYGSKHQLSISKFSQNESFEADIVLVDKMGELNNIYAISDIAIVGGAFKEGVGGHNPLEPAYFGCKIITGKHFPDQRELYKYVHHVQYVQRDEIHKALLLAKDLPPSMVEEKIDIQTVIEKIKEK